MLRTLALGIFIGVSNAADPGSGSGSGSGSGDAPVVPAGDNPCFAAETTMACKLTGDVSAAEAHRQCYTIHNTKEKGAALALMKTLTAGDVVLAADAAGTLSLERVIVNQHKANTVASALLEVHHSAGVLSLTPDHVLLVDGAFVPARNAKLGPHACERRGGHGRARHHGPRRHYQPPHHQRHHRGRRRRRVVAPRVDLRVGGQGPVPSVLRSRRRLPRDDAGLLRRRARAALRLVRRAPPLDRPRRLGARRPARGR